MHLLSKILFSILLLLTTIANGQKNNAIYTQNNLVGKTYIALVGEACKEMSDGGCMIYTSCILKFEKDSVTVSHKVRADCSPKEREKGYEQLYEHLKTTYKWTIKNKIVTIENFNNYGELTLQGNLLLGKEKRNYNKFEKIEFVQAKN